MSLEIVDHRVVYASQEYGHDYNTFPSAVVTPEGEVLVAFRRARHLPGKRAHIDVYSHAMLLRSGDSGKTFAASLLHEELYEGVQDPCLNLLPDGTLLTTFFTWLVQQRAFSTEPDEALWVPLGEKHVARIGGLYSIRSSDGGRSWDAPALVDAGPRALRGKGVALADGTFLSASYQRSGTVSVYRSRDRGLHWEPLADVAHPGGVSETTLLLTPKGKLVAFMRSRERRPGSEYPLMTAESHDLGKTWSTPVARPFYSSSPFEAIRLRSGKVLVSYGHRFAPFGIRAFLLDGECEQWEQAQETILREDGLGKDIGYTSSVELPNGEILIFYYFYGEDGYRHIAVTTCREA